MSVGAATETALQKLRAERQERVAGLMDRLGLDVLVCLSGGARGQRGNVRFLTNYPTTSSSSCVLWARSGLPRLVVPYSVHLYWAQFLSWIQDVALEADYANAISRYLEERGYRQGRIGWVGPPLLLDAVRARFQALGLEMECVSAQAAFSTLRTTKTPEEIKLVRQCADIADAVLDRVAAVLRPGVSERDLVAEAEYVARRMGSEGISILISRGALVVQPTPQDRPLNRGDIIQFSVEPEGAGGIWVQTVRMYALGEPAPGWARLAQVGVEAEQRAALVMKAGRPIASVAQAMLAVMAQAESNLVTPLGHGIGLDNSEPPRISGTTTDVLHQDMTIAIHPTEYRQEIAMYLGNTYLVQAEGAERLSKTPSGLIVL